MHVLLYAPYAALPPHFETDLELAQRHLDAGDEVTVLGCDAELPACYPNWDHARARCVGCVSRGRYGLSLLGGRVRRRPITKLTPAQRHELDQLSPRFSSVQALKAWKLGTFDIGFAVASSLISRTRDPEPDLAVHADLVQRLARAALLTYRSMQNHLATGVYDRVYVFNGRLADLRAALRAAQAMRVECFVHERGRDKDHLALFPNTTPHDLDWVRADLRRRWEAGRKDPRREEIARGFYERRAGGHPVMWYSFTKGQRAGQLPASWDSERHNVVAFTSSEDEFAAISDAWSGPLYANQLEGIRMIIEGLRERGGATHLTVRMHPNMRGLHDPQARAMRALRGACVTVVSPEAPVDSYALLQAADTVLTFGSTMGIEAVYWGKPSVLAGQCFFRTLGGTYEPESHEALVDLLARPLDCLDREAALMYGYYLATRGEPFVHYHAESLTTGTFRGHRVRPHLPLAALQGALRAARRLRSR